MTVRYYKPIGVAVIAITVNVNRYSTMTHWLNYPMSHQLNFNHLL